MEAFYGRISIWLPFSPNNEAFIGSGVSIKVIVGHFEGFQFAKHVLGHSGV